MGSEFEEYRVQDLIAQGKLAIGDGYRAKNNELARVGLPFARAGNINDGFHFDDCDCFPEVDLSRVGDKISQPGDVVFTSKGTVGRFAFVRSDTPRFVYSPQLCYWRALDAELIDSRYLFYWMCGPDFLGQYKGVAGQTDMAEYVSLADQRSMRLTLPPIDRQRAVARILGALDDKIESNRRMSQALESMARALFKSWFVDFDPVRAKAEGRDPGLPGPLADLLPDSFEDSEAGEVPKGWRLFGLDEIADFLNGLALQRFPANDGRTLPVIKIAQLHAGNTEGADEASAGIPSDYVVQDGDVLFSWSGSLSVELWCGGPGALNQHLFKVTSRLFPKWFYYHWTRQHLVDFSEIAAGKATTMGHIQRHHLSDAKVVVPAAAVLEAVDSVCGPITEASWRIRVQSRDLAGIRDSLLPVLLAGSTDVDSTIESAVGL
ncbi:MAG: restriction endonuclease subunit S [Candidatus Limnocylindrales bacterium]